MRCQQPDPGWSRGVRGNPSRAAACGCSDRVWRCRCGRTSRCNRRRHPTAQGRKGPDLRQGGVAGASSLQASTRFTVRCRTRRATRRDGPPRAATPMALRSCPRGRESPRSPDEGGYRGIGSGRRALVRAGSNPPRKAGNGLDTGRPGVDGPGSARRRLPASRVLCPTERSTGAPRAPGEGSRRDRRDAAGRGAVVEETAVAAIP